MIVYLHFFHFLIFLDASSLVLFSCVLCNFLEIIFHFLNLFSSVSGLLLLLYYVVFILPVASVLHSVLFIYVWAALSICLVYFPLFLPPKTFPSYGQNSKTTLFLRRWVKPVAKQLILKFILQEHKTSDK